MMVFNWIERIVSEAESEWADRRGLEKKEELLNTYPFGLRGYVGEVYRTRGKRVNKMRGFNETGLWSEESVRDTYPDIYEVVYQAKLCPHGDFVLTLFHNQLDLVGKEIIIREFGCVRHAFHWLEIGHSSSEVYPQDVSVLR